MPKGRYTVGGKGTHGCSGYPVVGDTGKVHGCHKTPEGARAQQAAIYASEASAKKSIDNCCDELTIDKARRLSDEAQNNESAGKRRKEKPMHKSASIVENHPDCSGFAIVSEDGTLDSCHKTRAEAEAAIAQHESPDSEMQNPGHDVNKFWEGSNFVNRRR